MPAATTQPPVVPQRPLRSQDMPKVPPRPIRRGLERSASPNTDRFAPSPLNDTFLSKSPNSTFLGVNNGRPLSAAEDAGAVEMPSLGEEGIEYAAFTEERAASSQGGSSRAASPEHTRSIGADLKLHAPKPSLPASSAKQRVATVTHTNSERAAAFGIGRPSSDAPTAPSSSTKKKASVTSQASSDDIADEETGIPEIGRQVPMYPNAGDVQAPSPAPGTPAADALSGKSHHTRKPSARGFEELPPGSYGLHGHGIIPSDRLEQAYYEKHPELAEKEYTPHHHDRAKDFSMSRDALDKIVRETASHGAGIGTHDINGTPSEQVGWQAIEETVSRPASTVPKSKSSSFGSQSSAPKQAALVTPGISLSAPGDVADEIIHVDDPRARRKSVMFSDEESPAVEIDEPTYDAPILASDEVAKDPLDPSSERRGSSFESSSRPTSRPASIHREPREYEPLFPQDDDNKPSKTASISSKSVAIDEVPSRFPSRDIWEEPPNSAFYTTEVSAPDTPIEKGEDDQIEDTPAAHVRASTLAPEGETPAQAFARKQEELAEKEIQGEDTFSENRQRQKPSLWTPQAKSKDTPTPPSILSHSSNSSTSTSSASRRPVMGNRFPSRDVWEDAPESLQLQTTVSHEQEEETSSPIEPVKPEVPQTRPVRKTTDPSKAAAPPAIPTRPKPKMVAAVAAAEEASTTKSAVPDRPKPQIPARPSAKPAMPARPFGGKIAQLQATFMSDLNKKLKIGPQAPKKEESAAGPSDEAAAPEAEKAPLVDARKGRARGPQRRAPQAAASAAATAAAPTAAPVTLGFSMPTMLYSIDPEDGELHVLHKGATTKDVVGAKEEVEVLKEEATVEKVEEKEEEPVVEEKVSAVVEDVPATGNTSAEAPSFSEAEATKDDSTTAPVAVEEEAVKE